MPRSPRTRPAGTVGTLTAGGATIGNTVTYSLVSEPAGGTNNNSLFQIAGNQLETTGPLAAGTYTVRVRSSSTFLISDVVDLTGINGPTAYQLHLRSQPVAQHSIRRGRGQCRIDRAEHRRPRHRQLGPGQQAANSEGPGSLAQTNYQGSYNAFFNSVTAANSSATVKNVVGSSGVDLANNAAWAVIDQPGEYAVTDTVIAEQVFTITVS